MPINLQPVDVMTDLQDAESVLIVPCPICPQFSLAMQNDSPWLEMFKYGLKTGALEDHISELRESLESRGIRSDVFTMRMPLPMMCLWTDGQRKRLAKRAQGYDTIIVLGCDSAAFTAEQVLGKKGCRVVQAMRMVGITNATVTRRFPLTFELEDASRVDVKQFGGSER